MKVGYQGIPGAYSDAACQKWLQRHTFPEEVTIKGLDNFKEMVEGLLDETIDYGIFPVENSTTGPITRTLDLFKHQPLLAVEEIYQEVSHVLWGIDNSRLEDITTVYSHPEALMQSQKLFDTYPQMIPQNAPDTARSAQMIAEKQNPHLGALASPLAGKLYGLKPLLTKVQSEEKNVTRFFVMRKVKESADFLTISPESKYSQHWYLYFETLHEPGALSKIIQVIDWFHLNMEGLHARPITDEPFKYGFLMEIDVTALKKEEDKTLFWQMLLHNCEELQLLGNFSSK